jgi:hypothetical protein
MSFGQDLKAGTEVEEEFVEFLKKFGIKAGRNTAKNTKEMALYDVFDSDYRTYEVKFDRKAKDTNNVFLEHESLKRSLSHYVVFKLDGDNNFYILDLPTVKNLIDNPDYPTKWGGSKPAVLGTLIPLKDFKEYFQIFSEKIFPKKKIKTSKGSI